MASAEPPGANASEPINVPNTPCPSGTIDNLPGESTPMEMSTLSRQTDGAAESIESPPPAQESKPIQEQPTSSPAEPSSLQIPSSQPQSDSPPSQNIVTSDHQPQPVSQVHAPPPQQPPPPSSRDGPNAMTRTTTQPAIEPSSDKSTPHPPEASSQTLYITLLLTNGARHPYKIDEKYLQKRNVSVEGNNPVLMSIYTLKELIWREWRDEWEARPSSPSSIRLIYAGFMPGDNSRLQECRFHLGPTPHVVHMTVKPQDFIDEEEAHKGGGREPKTERSPRCRCCVM